jgi:superfamily II DNA or RNA helicase
MPKLNFLPFKEAREFVRKQKFNSIKKYREWIRSEEAPKNIPIHPEEVYKTEWQGARDWLGNKDIPVNKKIFRHFEDARSYIHSLALKGKSEYSEWSKSDDRPIDIPTSPSSVYKLQWKGWGDWLGTGSIYTGDMKFLPFDEAREIVHSYGFKNKEQYVVWIKSKQKPANIPSSPARAYGELYLGWGDWLGTGRVANQKRAFLLFIESRAIVRGKKIKTREDWKEWINSGAFPNNIPKEPTDTYKSEWISWGDWFGSYKQWSKKALIGFIKGLYPILPNLEPAELYSILRNNNCLNAIEQLGEDSPLKQLINSALHGGLSNPQSLLKEIEKLEKGNDLDEVIEINDLKAINEFETLKEIIPTEKDVEELPSLSVLNTFDTLDHLEKVIGISDEETVEFLINKAIGRIWRKILDSSEPDIEIQKIRAIEGQKYSSIVKDRYLEQFEGAKNITMPTGYSFKKNGEMVFPNLMQKLVAYRLLKDSRLGNWSGTGAGKTLGAILGSRVVEAKLTIIIGLNNTVLDLESGWASEIRNAFPNSNIMLKERRDITFSTEKPNYLLLNYETFQLNDSKAIVDEIIKKHQVDLIVLDEIHSTKLRGQIESKRRNLINYLLQESASKNPNLRVLGMSATPVVNSLDEAVSLIEMIMGKEYEELDTAPKLSNALAIHEQLVLNGIRYVPNYAMELIEKTFEITDNSITDKLQQIGKGQIAQIEIELLKSKIPSIIELCKPSTIIYSQYVEEIFDQISNAVKSAGMTVARFNGEDKTGLDLFKQRKVDILIGSSSLGTGVDGLQYVCNRLIIACLPWTSAGYEQLLGRIYRQGSKFNEVEVFIPQIVLSNNGDIWSWDKQRLNRIKYKKTLADATVDGIIPEANLAEPSKMLAEAKKALDEWVTRLEDGEVYELTRKELRVPLPPEAIDHGIKKYGDFSMMNQRINTSKSITTHDRLATDPEEFYLYHSLYRKARETWTEIPFQVIAEQLNKRPDWVIGDFGCGEALLSKSLQNKVYSFDHVAINPSVIACDMSNTGQPNEILDVAVFSLALMGVNWEDYFKEAYRLLRAGGLLKIAEPASKWSDDDFRKLKDGIENAGFNVSGKPKLSSKFVYIDAMKPL